MFCPGPSRSGHGSTLLYLQRVDSVGSLTLTMALVLLLLALNMETDVSSSASKTIVVVDLHYLARSGKLRKVVDVCCQELVLKREKGE